MKHLDELLNKSNKGIDDAVKELHKLQHGFVKPIKTSLEFLNELTFGGLQKNMIIALSGRPSHSKTFTAHRLRRDIMTNSQASLLYFNWEMSWFNLLILEVKKILKKPLQYILNNPPTEEEIVQMKKVADEFRDSRFTSVDKALTPDEFYYVTEQWILQNIEKDHLVIMIDHIGITKGSNKTDAIYQVVEYCNELKLKYPNKLTFVILSQLNREIEKLWRTRDTNPVNLRVTSEYLFAADSIFQGCDLVIAMVIPQRAGLDKYCAINIEKNEHLREHVCEDESSDKEYVRLKGLNRVYYDVIKKRLDDNSPSLYCEIMDPEAEEIQKAFEHYEKDHTMDEDVVF